MWNAIGWMYSPSMRDQREASFEALENVPSNCVGEIVDDKLYVSPRPGSIYARAAGRLAQVLAPFDKSSGTDGLS